MVDYNLVRIIAMTNREARKILDELLIKRMLTVGYINKLSQRILRGAKVASKNVFEITGLTPANKRQAVVNIVRKLHSSKTPDVTFHAVKAANPDFIYSIKEKAKETPNELKMLR